MFKPQCLPILIGSLPLTDHRDAVDVILTYSSTIPLWPQLPKLPKEGMVRQFLSGFPGLQEDGSRFWIDTGLADFEDQMTSFYQEYMEIEDNPLLLESSRFAVEDDTAPGFAVFTDVLSLQKPSLVNVKGQITGPVTTGIGVKDQHNRGIIYNDSLRDILVKLLALKGRWQIEELKKATGLPSPILFIDEPGIVSFGSTGFMGVTREMVSEAVAEIIAAIHKSDGLAGIHICANGDWGPALNTDTDIISFDAFFYFDNFILYKDMLTSYLQRGGILAWGIVPTGDPGILEGITLDELFEKWKSQLKTLTTFGFSEQQLMQQTLIAPSCGTGSLSIDLAVKVLQLTQDLSIKAREYYLHSNGM